MSKRFVKSLDLAAKIGNRLGANVREEVVHAVDNVDLAVFPGEVVGLVGESGCGKSTLGRLAAGLLTLSDGERFWRGTPLGMLASSDARRQQLQAADDLPGPVRVAQPADARRRHRRRGAGRPSHLIGPAAGREYVGLMLNEVGLDPTLMRRYPHQFSGGQRARIGIARALAVKPEFLVCDESVAALDVSIQAQVLNLFMDLKSALNLTYLFISHDLGVVQFLADRVVVMYLGRDRRERARGGALQRRRTIRTRRRCSPKSAGRAEEAHVRSDRGRDPVAARSAVGLSLPSALPARDAALSRKRAAVVRRRHRGVRAACWLSGDWADHWCRQPGAVITSAATGRGGASLRRQRGPRIEGGVMKAIVRLFAAACSRRSR